MVRVCSTSLESAAWPIKRLAEKMVREGLVTACRFATCPTRRSPASLKATIEGVVLAPSAFWMTVGSPASMMLTHELVVPKSIPITFDMLLLYNYYLILHLRALVKQLFYR